MVSKNNIGSRHSSGIAYVIIPEGVERNKYVRFCYSTGTVSIVMENGGLMENVLMSKHLWDHIVFPDTTDTLGSMVSWNNIPSNNAPVIVGVFSKKGEVIQQGEGQASFYRDNKQNSGDFTVDENTGDVFINANALVREGGNIYIKSKNGGLDSIVKIASSGSIELSSQQFSIDVSDELNITIDNPEIDENNTTIAYKKGEGFTYEDEFDNKIEISDGKVDIDSENINLGASDANESMLLGDTTVDLLQDLIDILSKTQVPTSIGPQFFISAPQLAALLPTLESLKSKKHKIE